MRIAIFFSLILLNACTNQPVCQYPDMTFNNDPTANLESFYKQNPICIEK